VVEKQISVAASDDFETTLSLRADDVYFVSLTRD